MLVRAVVLLGVLLTGLVAPPAASVSIPAGSSAPASSPAAASPVGAMAVAAKKKPRAALTASYMTLQSGEVRVTVASNAKKVRLTYRTAKNKKRTATVKIRNGAGAKTLKKGSKRIYAQAKATKKSRASKKIRVTVGAPAQPGNGTSPAGGALTRYDVTPDRAAPEYRSVRYPSGWSGPWSPDGQWAAFSGCEYSYHNCQTFLKNVFTGDVRIISTNPSGDPACLDASCDVTNHISAWTADGTRVVLTTQANNMGVQPWVSNGTVMVVKDLTTGSVVPAPAPSDSGPWLDLGAATLADGTTVLLYGTGMSDSASRYALVDLDSGGTTYLTGAVRGSTASGWLSPRGDVLVEQVRGVEAHSELRLLSVGDGRLIGSINAPDAAPVSFSRDGSALYFTSTACPDSYAFWGCQQLSRYSMGARASQVIVPWRGGPGDTAFGFKVSPDGHQVAFQVNSMAPVSPYDAADTNRKTDVMVWDLATGTARTLSVDSSGGQSPCDAGGGFWSPDSTRITFHTCESAWVPGGFVGTEAAYIKIVRQS